MQLTLSIINAQGTIKATASAEQSVTLVYQSAYEEGDTLRLQSDDAGHVIVQLDSGLSPTYGYLTGDYHLPIPFGEKKESYAPSSFIGDTHLLWVRAAQPQEAGNYRNLALNPLDHHGNTGLFPHAKANVETRGESVFAARNTIDGNIASNGHGPWPYESWGVGLIDDPEIAIHFGREVTIDKLILVLRADFPHDNWWQTALVSFSDGSESSLSFVKSGQPQVFCIPKRTVTWLKMSGMVKDPGDPSPFPALVELEAWGWG